MALWLAKPYLPRPGRQEAFLAPAGDQERVRSAKRGNASCQGKPTGPQWRPVRDAMLFRNDLEELLMAPLRKEEEWHKVYTEKRLGETVSCPHLQPCGTWPNRCGTSQDMTLSQRLRREKCSNQPMSTTRAPPRRTSGTRRWTRTRNTTERRTPRCTRGSSCRCRIERTDAKRRPLPHLTHLTAAGEYMNQNFKTLGP